MPNEKLIAALVLLGVGLLLAFLLTPIFGRVRESGLHNRCLRNIRQLGLAMTQYSLDNGDQFPVESNDAARCFSILTNGNYLVPGEVFVCPEDSSPRTGNPLVSSNISYGVMVIIDAPTYRSESNSDWPWIFDRGVIGAKPSQPVLELIGAGWTPRGAHGAGGYVFNVGGRAAFQKVLFDIGLTNNPAITNAIALFPR